MRATEHGCSSEAVTLEISAANSAHLTLTYCE